MTRIERRLALRAWRSILPARPGFEDRDLEAALDLLLERTPPRGRVAFRAAVLVRTALRGAAPRAVVQLLKGALFLAALARPEGRRALGIEP